MGICYLLPAGQLCQPTMDSWDEPQPASPSPVGSGERTLESLPPDLENNSCGSEQEDKRQKLTIKLRTNLFSELAKPSDVRQVNGIQTEKKKKSEPSKRRKVDLKVNSTKPARRQSLRQHAPVTYFPELEEENDAPKSQPETNNVKKPLKVAETRKKASSKKEERENNDWCAACGDTGEILCCENCPRSFHFTCLEPPLAMEDISDDEPWLCRVCEGRHKSSKRSPAIFRGLFGELENLLSKRNSTCFQLPRGLKDRYEGAKSDGLGEFQPDKPRAEEHDPWRLFDKNGDPIQCFKCGLSALHGPLLTCELCDVHWHLDCVFGIELGPQVPLPARWTCPNHVTELIKSAPLISRTRLTRPFRKPQLVTPSLTRGVSNDGYIEVAESEEEEDIEEHVRDVPFIVPTAFDRNGVVVANGKPSHFAKVDPEQTIYKLPSRAIKLDFIDVIKMRWQQDPWKETPTSDLLTAFDEIRDAPASEADKDTAVDLMKLKLQGPDVSSAMARENMNKLVDAALGEDEKENIAAIKRMMEIKGRARLLDFLKN